MCIFLWFTSESDVLCSYVDQYMCWVPSARKSDYTEHSRATLYRS